MIKFLTLKHWQLFLLLVGTPLIFEFILFNFAFSSKNPMAIISFFPVLMILTLGLFFSWFYSLGTNLFKKLPVTEKMNVRLFKIFLFLPAVCMIIVMLATFSVFSNVPSGGMPNFTVLIIIFPLELFAMFSMFYSLYFIAKALKTIEWQKPVTFSDYAGEFFLLWFFPIGIWILQPRINKLFDTTPDDPGESIF